MPWPAASVYVEVGDPLVQLMALGSLVSLTPLPGAIERLPICAPPPDIRFTIVPSLLPQWIQSMAVGIERLTAALELAALPESDPPADAGTIVTAASP